jgi:hypothetical protein
MKGIMNVWTNEVPAEDIQNIFQMSSYLLTYSMEQSPSVEADRFVAIQEIPRISWNP